MRVRLATPPDFSFRRTVDSHGWCDLAPFDASVDRSSVATVVPLDGGGARRIVLREDAGAVLESPGPADAATRRALIAAGRRILALDVDVSEFHEAVRGDPRYRWIAETRSGRLLRAPTAFEDVVKLVLTTNCSWAFTKQMTNALVTRYGETTADGARSFPTPRRLARVAEMEYRVAVRAGYRAPYLAALSRAVVKGEADPASWDDDLRGRRAPQGDRQATGRRTVRRGEPPQVPREAGRPRARFRDPCEILRDVPRRAQGEGPHHRPPHGAARPLGGSRVVVHALAGLAGGSGNMSA